MDNKLNPIKVKRGNGVLIAKVFGCTPARVSQALYGTGNAGLTTKIRHVALTQYGGVEYEPIKPKATQL